LKFIYATATMSIYNVFRHERNLEDKELRTSQERADVKRSARKKVRNELMA